MNLTILQPYYYGGKTWRPYPCLSAALTFYWDQSCVNEGGEGGGEWGWEWGGGVEVVSHSDCTVCIEWDCVFVCPSVYVSLKIHLYCSAYEIHLYCFAKIVFLSVHPSMCHWKYIFTVLHMKCIYIYCLQRFSVHLSICLWKYIYTVLHMKWIYL